MIKFFNNLPLGTKIFSSFILVIILISILTAVNFIQAQMVIDNVNNVFNKTDNYYEKLWDTQVVFDDNTRVLEEYGNGYETLAKSQEIFSKNYTIISNNLLYLESGVKSGYVSSKALNDLKIIKNERKKVSDKIFSYKDVVKDSAMVRSELERLDILTAEGRLEFDLLKKQLLAGKANQLATISNIVNVAKIILVTIPLVTILFIFIISYLLSKIIISSIRRLTQAAEEVAGGNFNKEILINSKDEIGQLAKVFNEMTGKISDSHAKLQLQKDEYIQKNLELEQNTAEMQKTQKAMLNILEDSRNMEKQMGIQAKDLEKFKLVIEHTSDHVIITDPEGKIIFANNSAEKLTGFTRKEMYGNTPRLWGRQMPKDLYVEMWATIKNLKQVFKGEIINKNKAGEQYPVEAMITPILDEADNVVFFVGIERDISADKKLAERVLVEKEEIQKQVQAETKLLLEEKVKFSASINSLRVGFVMFDKLGEVLFNNRALEKILGLDNKPKTIDEIQNMLVGLPIKENYKNCLDAGQPLNIKEIAYKDKFLHLYLAPIFSADNSFEIIGIVVLVEDVSEEKILNRSRDEFFSIASHELRTPLTAIRGNTSLIQQYYLDKLPDNDIKEMISDINESSIRLIQIVNDFLNMSRLEMGKMLFKKEPIRVLEMVRGVIKECELGGASKNLYIKFEEPAGAIPDALGDAVRAREVLMNLIGNAVKYTEKGGLTISIKIDGKFVKVMVADTGRGISAENQKLLFKKFQQASDSIHTRDALKGTGLGLYISKLMMEGVGGKVELDSTTEGQGSTFSMSIPVNE